jgi:hypothetical protein
MLNIWSQDLGMDIKTAIEKIRGFVCLIGQLDHPLELCSSLGHTGGKIYRENLLGFNFSKFL